MPSLDNGKVLIHGKEYETVASRVHKFREQHGEEYGIITELIDRDDNTVVMKASIVKGELVIATGYAEENRSASSINRTSALENCETSAIGRALAAFGLAGTEYASADEVAQAIHQQGADNPLHKQLTGLATDKQKVTISSHLKVLGVSEEDQGGYLIEQYGVDLPLSKQAASEIIDSMFAR